MLRCCRGRRRVAVGAMGHLLLVLLLVAAVASAKDATRGMHARGGHQPDAMVNLARGTRQHDDDTGSSGSLCVIVVDSPDPASQSSRCFDEVVTALVAGVRLLGGSATVHHIRPGIDWPTVCSDWHEPPPTPSIRGAVVPVSSATGRTRHVVLGANLLFALPEYAEALPLPPDFIVYNLEQVGRTQYFSGNILQQMRKYQVWEYSPLNADLLAAQGVATVPMPVGYTEALSFVNVSAVQVQTEPATMDTVDSVSDSLQGAEDIDVLLVGVCNPGRCAVIQAVADMGFVARLAGPACGRGACQALQLPPAYGAERDALLLRAKIIVNVHFFEASIFEIVRVSYLLANLRFVISERGKDTRLEQPFEQGIVFADSRDDIPRLCREYLQAPTRSDAARRRAEVARTGLAIVQNLHVERFLRCPVFGIDARRSLSSTASTTSHGYRTTLLVHEATVQLRMSVRATSQAVDGVHTMPFTTLLRTAEVTVQGQLGIGGGLRVLPHHTDTTVTDTTDGGGGSLDAVLEYDVPGVFAFDKAGVEQLTLTASNGQLRVDTLTGFNAVLRFSLTTATALRLTTAWVNSGVVEMAAAVTPESLPPACAAMLAAFARDPAFEPPPDEAEFRVVVVVVVTHDNVYAAGNTITQLLEQAAAVHVLDSSDTDRSWWKSYETVGVTFEGVVTDQVGHYLAASRHRLGGTIGATTWVVNCMAGHSLESPWGSSVPLRRALFIATRMGYTRLNFSEVTSRRGSGHSEVTSRRGSGQGIQWVSSMQPRTRVGDLRAFSAVLVTAGHVPVSNMFNLGKTAPWVGVARLNRRGTSTHRQETGPRAGPESMHPVGMDASDTAPGPLPWWMYSTDLPCAPAATSLQATSLPDPWPLAGVGCMGRQWMSLPGVLRCFPATAVPLVGVLVVCVVATVCRRRPGIRSLPVSRCSSCACCVMTRSRARRWLPMWCQCWLWPRRLQLRTGGHPTALPGSARSAWPEPAMSAPDSTASGSTDMTSGARRLLRKR